MRSARRSVGGPSKWTRRPPGRRPARKCWRRRLPKNGTPLYRRRWRCCAPTECRWWSIVRFSSRDEALEKVESVGYPIALKIDHPIATHKSVVGGIQLNLLDDYGLITGWDKIDESVKEAGIQDGMTRGRHSENGQAGLGDGHRCAPRSQFRTGRRGRIGRRYGGGGGQ